MDNRQLNRAIFASSSFSISSQPPQHPGQPPQRHVSPAEGGQKHPQHPLLPDLLPPPRPEPACGCGGSAGRPSPGRRGPPSPAVSPRWPRCTSSRSRRRHIAGTWRGRKAVTPPPAGEGGGERQAAATPAQEPPSRLEGPEPGPGPGPGPHLLGVGGEDGSGTVESAAAAPHHAERRRRHHLPSAEPPTFHPRRGRPLSPHPPPRLYGARAPRSVPPASGMAASRRRWLAPRAAGARGGRCCACALAALEGAPPPVNGWPGVPLGGGAGRCSRRPRGRARPSAEPSPPAEASLGLGRPSPFPRWRDGGERWSRNALGSAGGWCRPAGACRCAAPLVRSKSPEHSGLFWSPGGGC